MVSRVRQNPDKRKPEQNQQVHDHEDASDPGFAGFGGAGANVVETVAVFALSELILNGNSFAVIVLSLALINLFGQAGNILKNNESR